MLDVRSAEKLGILSQIRTSSSEAFSMTTVELVNEENEENEENEVKLRPYTNRHERGWRNVSGGGGVQHGWRQG
jgi:hypothetical protein